MFIIWPVICFWLMSIFGYGTVFSHFLLSKKDQSSSLSLYFIKNTVLGLFVLFFFSLLINFFLPLAGLVSLLVFFVGLGLLCKNRKEVGEMLGKISTFEKILFLVLFLYLILVPLHRDKWFWNDTVIYQIQSIKWAAESPLILGLGNLNHGFAFNSTIFSFAALLEWPILLQGKAHYIALPFFVFSLLVFYFFAFRNFFKTGNVTPGLILVSITLISMLFYYMSRPLSMDYDSINGLNSFLFLFLLFEHLDYYKRDKEKLKKTLNDYIIIFIFLASILGTSKLNMAFFIFPAFFLFFFHWKDLPKSLKNKIMIIIPIYGALFFIKSIMISGCLIFPLKPLCFTKQLSWAIPQDDVDASYGYIVNYARNAGGVGDNPDWLDSWKARMWKAYAHYVFIFLGGLLLNFIFCLKKKREENLFYSPFFYFLISFLTFWFFKAPDTRFGVAFMVICTFLPMSYFLYHIYKGEGDKPREWMKIGVYLSLVLAFDQANVIEHIRKNRNRKFPQAVQQDIKIRYTRNHIPINTPTGKDGIGTCWELPLPCSPAPMDIETLHVFKDKKTGKFERFVSVRNTDYYTPERLKSLL